MKDLRILANLIEDKKNTNPDLDVLTFVNVLPCGDLEHEIRTYKSLWEQGQRVFAGLRNEGMSPGDSFAMVMQNHPEFVDCMVGSSLAGTVFVPIDPRTSGDRLEYMLSWADCKGVICADYCLNSVLAACKNLPQIRWVWVLQTGELIKLPTSNAKLKKWSSIANATVVEASGLVQSPNETMQMLYTSGTTGDPKAIRAPYTRYDAVSSIGPMIGLNQDDRPYTGLSFTHANAQLISLGNILKMGLRGVISRRFTKSRLWDICRAYGCTTFNLLGGMTTAIYSEPVRANDANNPVRFILSAGMPSAIWHDFSERFKVELFEFYGAAEGGMMFNPPGVGPVGSIGKPPASLKARIIDEQGNACPPGVHGEIVFEAVEGEPLAVEYYKNPEASLKKTQDGVLYMGDIGHQDEDGWYYFDSRKGDEIRRNGEFVDVARIEKIIAEFNDVEDVFVYGIPAQNGAPGEKDVIAAVVPVEARLFDPDVLVNHCRQVLGRNDLPSYIQVMSEIPKTASEKPQSRFCYEYFLEQKNHVYDVAS
ncbi:Long-chain-fatty-acid--CoA ligase [Zhongshania aliphaticivorans]|uniref:Long-chain-fatty-acid--CoA ligase n=1 Tax=Zhongshania aliphaticivorans TaxID=1470434 RepID=A0A5S9QVL8_9GAMM|nr:AMP-binding protein [Zhongshania aliphaticivorans]CAA0114673.1 Long-chain-fatty-acid--CoA ligase [Zhongshania aliphaticivorans]CAA0122979.1 Long-chain-fatty-acid--CoA ligase [Zhongshania aliphaticivorans]